MDEMNSPGAENFEDLAWLFQCDSRNRGIIRQGFDEAALLWKAVKATAGNIIEIGRNHAGSTALLAAASPGRKIYSIDLAPDHVPATDEFLRRAEFRDRLNLLTGDSRKTLPGVTCGFLFVDGDHSFKGVLADVVAHWNALHDVDGRSGLAAFHDALPNENFKWRDADRKIHRLKIRLKNKVRKRQKPEIAPDYEEGVYRVCRKLIDTGCAEEWGRASSMWVLRKKTDLPAGFAQSF